mmetsp:Transcript_2947/g.3986  ORF Transcript_2947/g.3986 Transcript_2947/m.3986 type:complete len:382 (-) Transcript_2947:2139-3284(-)
MSIRKSLSRGLLSLGSISDHVATGINRRASTLRVGNPTNRLRWRKKYDTLSVEQVSALANFDQSKLTLKYKYKELQSMLKALAKIYAKIEENEKKGYRKFTVERAMDKAHNAIQTHQKFKKKERDRWASWKRKNDSKNKAALERMRRIVPENIKYLTEEQLRKDFNFDLARRLYRQAAFRMYHMELEEMQKIHPSDMKHRYYFNGFDLTELRALYAATEGLQKGEWTKTLKEKIFSMTKREEEGDLTPREKENPAYKSTRTKEDVENSRSSVSRRSCNRMGISKNEIEMEQVWKARERRASSNTGSLERKNSLTYQNDDEREIAELTVKALQMIDDTSVDENDPEFVETMRRLSVFSSTDSNDPDFDMDFDLSDFNDDDSV